MSQFEKDTIVKNTARGHFGKVISTGFSGVYVFNAASGQKADWKPQDLEPATREEYDAQVEARMKAEFQARADAQKPKALSNPTTKQPIQRVSLPAQTFRWMCLECGYKYNGQECPHCSGTDRILNYEKDLDPTYRGSERNAPYAPKD